jgi:hypothetical protein
MVLDTFGDNTLLELVIEFVETGAGTWNSPGSVCLPHSEGEVSS